MDRFEMRERAEQDSRERPGERWAGTPHRGDWSEGSSSPGTYRLQSLRPPRGGAVGQTLGWRREIPWGWHGASEEERTRY